MKFAVKIPRARHAHLDEGIGVPREKRPVSRLEDDRERLSRRNDLRENLLSDLPTEGDQPCGAFVLHTLGDLPREGRGGGILPSRIGEHVHREKAGFSHEVERLGKFFFRLAGESDHQVGGKLYPRHGSPGACERGKRLCAVISSLHTAEDAVRAALHRKMKVRDGCLQFCHAGNEIFAHQLGGQRAETDPFDAPPSVKLFNEIDQAVAVVKIGTVGRRLDPRQHDLTRAGGGECLHLGDDVCRQF